MIKINSLGGISFNKLYEAFSDAFQDYEIPVLKLEELKTMLMRRGFVPELSYGAFDQGRLVSFTFNGIGSFNGKKTAYDAGTGTIKEYRGMGLAKMIFNESLIYLKEAQIKQYLLEVLQKNKRAFTLYSNLGFRISREFNYHILPAGEIKLKEKNLPEGYQLKRTDLKQMTRMMTFWDFTPSWQNSYDAVRRKPEDFVITGAYYNNSLIGYGIIEPGSGDITQIAVDKQHRRKGVGSSLLKELLRSNGFHSVKIVNTEKGCDSIYHFLNSNNITLKGTQYEMIKIL